MMSRYSGRMNTPSIRQAGMDDLGTLIPLFDQYRQFYGRNSDPIACGRFLQARIERRESVILLPHQHDETVGFVQLYPSFSSVSMAPVFVLNDLFVATNARKRGVAGALLMAAGKHAESAKAARLSLVTGKTNLAAQSLYQRTGWKRDEVLLAYHLNLSDPT